MPAVIRSGWDVCRVGEWGACCEGHADAAGVVHLFRLQAPLGGLLAALLPRAQIVPAVPLDQLSNDPIVVRQLALWLSLLPMRIISPQAGAVDKTCVAAGVGAR